MHVGNGDGNIQRGRPKGHNTGALSLFKERSPPVLINPHFTFHISGRLSGPTGRKSIHLPPFLCSHKPFVAHIHAPLRYPCRLAQFQPLLLSRSLSEPSRARVFIFFHPLSSLRGVFDSSLRIGGGSRFLIQEMCPSVDTRLPSARHLQLLIPNTARAPHPQITFFFGSPTERLQLTGTPWGVSYTWS